MTHSFPTRRSSDPIPHQPGKLSAGGKLQALAIKGQKSFDTRNWEETTIQPGHPLDAEWIDLENVDSPKDDLHVRGFEQGAARFARGRSEEHTSELQSLMRISYAVFCLKKKQ